MAKKAKRKKTRMKNVKVKGHTRRIKADCRKAGSSLAKRHSSRGGKTLGSRKCKN